MYSGSERMPLCVRLGSVTVRKPPWAPWAGSLAHFATAASDTKLIVPANSNNNDDSSSSNNKQGKASSPKPNRGRRLLPMKQTFTSGCAEVDFSVLSVQQDSGSTRAHAHPGRRSHVRNNA